MKQGNSLVTLVIVLLAVMLAAYLGVYAWDSFTDPFTTTLTYSYTANDSLEADGWVVREEPVSYTHLASAAPNAYQPLPRLFPSPAS